MILENIDLADFSTFGIHAIARKFARFSTAEELQSILENSPDEQVLILGGGSNILFTKDFNGLVLRNEIRGITLRHETEKEVIVCAGAGEVWHEFVLHCIENGYGGIENLSLIPGSVGASPMQNIGAYGVEIKDVFESLEAYHIPSGEVHTFRKDECRFGYRESVFKRELKDQYVILSVCYRLSKYPEVNTRYGIINDQLKVMGIGSATIKDVSDAVIAIRQSKLPDPSILGNAGSFFKNPVIDESLFHELQSRYPDIPNYPAGAGRVKLAAGWLIEQAGWKGWRRNDVGVHEKQALVLVNYGSATGREIFDLSTAVLSDIHEKFGVELEREVNIL